MIRSATPHDATEVVDLILIVLRDMELDIFNTLTEERVTELLVTAYNEYPLYRYGYKRVTIKEIDGKVAGIAFGYPSHLEKNIDNDFITLLIKQGLTKDHAFFNDSETKENEWYLDTLVTSPDFRGQGVATELLNSLDERAKMDGESIIALNVDQINDRARAIYLNNGFKKTSEMMIANHNYDHLQRKIK